MFKIDIKEWAFNFFTNTKLTTENTIVSTQPEYLYDLHSAMTSLKFALQDDAISRIPPNGKLPHKHYRNPLIFSRDPEETPYVVLEKFEKDDHYVETYLRLDGAIYHVGYESRKKISPDSFSKNPSSCENHDVCLFEVDANSRLYKTAMEHLKEQGIVDLHEMYTRYLERKAAFEALLKSIIN